MSYFFRSFVKRKTSVNKTEPDLEKDPGKTSSFKFMPGKNTIANLSFLSILIIFFAVGCTGRTGSENEETPEVEELSQNLRESEEYGLWELILGDYQDGLFRGVSFNDSREKVRITETFEVFEELPSQIGYTHDTKELETVDVYYHFSDEQLVSRIIVDVFLNGESSADRLWEISGWYFNSRFGPASETSDMKKVWQSGEATVTVENVSGGLDQGLKITFVPVGRSVVAKKGASFAGLALTGRV